MELDNNKTLITPLTKGVSFLGFIIQMFNHKQMRLKHTLIKKNGQNSKIIRRTSSRKITIRPDKERILSNLRLKKFCDDKNYPIGLRFWTIYDPYEIVLKYRQIMIRLTNYYCKCDNLYILYRASYILQYSCAKTIATRRKISMPQVFKKYGSNLTITKQFYINNKPQNRSTQFKTFTDIRKDPNFRKHKHSDNFYPFHTKEYLRTKLKLYEDCCICGSTENIGMHHINSLRKIKPPKRDKFEYIRSMTNRIQIPVCQACHNDLTHGRYDKQNPIKF